MKISKKRLMAGAAAIGMLCSSAFAETNETLKAHSLKTGVGDITFGAWGRSTFNIGHQSTSTKITADTTSTGNTAIAAADAAILAYETAKANGDTTALSGYGVTDVTLASDNSNYTEYATAVATYAGVKAAIAGGDGTSTGAQVGNAMTAYALVNTLKGLQEDTSDSSNYAGLDPDWSYGCRVGFWIVGRTPDEHFGFDFNLDADARALFVHKLWDSTESTADTNYNEDGKYAVAIGDQAKIWGLFDNPLFQTKVAFGRMRENELRGSIGDFGQRESSDVKSEDDIFQEIWTATGLFTSVKGNEDSVLKGFYANAAIDLAGNIGLTTDSNNNTVSTNASAADTDSDKAIGLYDAFRTAQAGIGYTLPGLFQVKAQYWGDSIAASNYRYEASKYQTARDAGYGMNDYYGRVEIGFDWLGFMGGASGLGDVDLEKTPNANLIEAGLKLPIVTRDGLRDYDPEKFYNWYACVGTMGVIQKGFILYKGHIWGGQGTSNLAQYSYDLVTMEKGYGADILMAGADFLTEVCVNPFGKQDLFVGLSGNYNITSANADGKFTYSGNSLNIADLNLMQHKFAAEVYVKKTFAANNYMFAGLCGNFTFQSMEGTVENVVDLSYKANTKKFYMPIGIEMFF